MKFLIKYILCYKYHTMFTLDMHVHDSLIFYTLIRSSESLNLYSQVYEYFFYWASIWGDHVYLRSMVSLLLDHQILWCSSCFPFHSVGFLWFSIAWTSYYSIWLIRRIILSCVRIICIIAVSLLPLLLIYITCLEHFRLACIRRVFSSRIYIADSHRVFAPAYFGKRDVRIFFCIRARFEIGPVLTSDLNHVIFTLQ